jgi:hypothetical protein
MDGPLHNHEGTLWERLANPSTDAFCKAASIKQDHGHFPLYMEYIFPPRQKAVFQMPSPKCKTT